MVKPKPLSTTNRTTSGRYFGSFIFFNPTLSDGSLPQISKDMLQVLDALKVKKVYIFGNSLGGPIAVRMYMLKPERVAALILCAKHPPVEVSRLHSMATATLAHVDFAD